MMLIVYQADTYKEYMLPNIDNSNYTLRLDKHIFSAGKDIELVMDVADRLWTVYDCDAYDLYYKGAVRKKHVLRGGDILSFKMTDGLLLSVFVSESDMEFSVLRKYDLRNVGYISIGESKDSIVAYAFNDLVSKHHCEIRKHSDGYYIEDHSKNGIFLEHKKIKKRYKLRFGDAINIFGLRLVFLDSMIGIGSGYGSLTINEEYLKPAVLQSGDGDSEKKHTEAAQNRNVFNRSPRNIPTIHAEAIEIEPPPEPKFTKKKPILYTIGPAFTMAIPMALGSSMAMISSRFMGSGMGSSFMYTGIVMAVLSAVIGVVWGLLNMRYAKQTEAEEEQQRFNAYSNYLYKQVEEIKTNYEENYRAMHSMYVSSEQCCDYDVHLPVLWNRNYSHKDFMTHRLGLGDIPFQVDIKIPKDKFSMVYDSLKEKPAIIKREYETLRNVPVCIDLLQEKLIGIVGGSDKSGAMTIMYNLVGQIAANNCYTDVKMAFIYDEESLQDKSSWAFARWLPHVWSEDKKTRYLAANQLEATDVFYELSNILRTRAEEAGSHLTKKQVKPYYILFVQDRNMIEGELISKYIYETSDVYGLTTFILTDAATNLPNSCERIIQLDRSFSGIYKATDYLGEKKSISFDSVSVDALTAFAKRISDIRVNESESTIDIPSSLDFFEMYGVHSLKELNVAERWRKNRTFNTMRALIGRKAGGNDCYLDIHEKAHGPHGLVAGTTGSGKSELLQTYILSMALNYSPEDIAFFVIDYKGGGMANLFANLPHMIGQISNLSGNQVHRAMISIKSENIRRQRLFNECGVNNINLYTRLYKSHETAVPIPHLFIIIDEFAELKKEEPDFMRELISVAQVGRSLGVHLILSTQKPSGTVDDNIWSNSKFRLCLRVQDRQDSNDMLRKPDAAYITQAGRAFLQVGNDELYELFQSGWSGAPYNEWEDNVKSEISMILLNTGKTALVGSRVQIKRKEKEHLNWYGLILTCVRGRLRALGFDGIGSVKAMEASERESFIAALVNDLNTSGADYPDTKTNRNSLWEFLSLWREDLREDSEIIAAILAAAQSRNIKLPEKKEKTQLEAIVGHLNKTAAREGYNFNLQLWLPVLPQHLYLQDMEVFASQRYADGKYPAVGKTWSLEAVVGMYDDPQNQTQLPLTVDFAKNGHHAVIGMVVSGKSTFLQTLLYAIANRYSPDHLSMYILDFSSQMLAPFGELPHCGGVMFDADHEKISKFFFMMNAEMDKRKAMFGGGNYVQFVQAYGKKLPAWLVVIDNMGGFREKTDGVYEESLLRLAKEGIGYGIYMVTTAAGFGIAEIPSRIAESIRTILCLEMGDKYKYMDVLRTTHITTLPEVGVKGRGLANVDGNLLEFHTALTFESEDDFARSRQIAETCAQMRAQWSGGNAAGIPVIPEEPTLQKLEELEAYQQALTEQKSLLPFAYSMLDASVYSVDLSATYCYSISGKSRTGKTNTLKLLMKAAAAKGGRSVVFEKDSAELKRTADLLGFAYIKEDGELFNFFSSLKDEFVSRNALKRKCVNEGMSELEIYACVSEEPPIFLFIADMSGFIDSVYRPQGDVGEMKGFVENITQKGYLHNIFMFACINNDTAAVASTYAAYKSFVGYKTGVHLGGNVNTQKIFAFRNIPHLEQSKVYKKGIGLVPQREDETVAEKIVIPLMQ